MTEQKRPHVIQPLWLKLRFYLVIVAATALLFVILRNNSAENHTLEYLSAALLSLANAITAYCLSKNKDSAKDYKNMVRRMGWFMAGRIAAIVLISCFIIFILKANAVYYIMSFIGFYILHQLVLILIMRKEAGITHGKKY